MESVQRLRTVDDGSRMAGRQSGSAWRHYLALTKPRLISLVLVTTAVGYVMGATTAIPLIGLLHVLVSVALVAAGGGALNQHREREFDARMLRTATRPLPMGVMRPAQAFWFGIGLTALGLAYTGVALGLLTLGLAVVSVGLYLLAYTPLKRTSPLCPLVGAITGALPPVMGWTAAGGPLDLGAAALFAILYVWQLPHFLAIAWLYRDDYARAGFAIARLSSDGGRGIAGAMPWLVVLLTLASVLPRAVGLTGSVYLTAAVAMGVVYIVAALWQPTRDVTVRARRLFRVSLIYLPVLLLVMAWDRLPRTPSTGP
ncbi:MAG: heme o synthase [Candidatus Zixiibacteriota bacterium]